MERFAPTHTYRNRLLRIDLSDGRIWAQETTGYLPGFLGARGLAAGIVWDGYPDPIGAFDPKNPLIVVPGTMIHRAIPYSGRTTSAPSALSRRQPRRHRSGL